jgi:hypothetical protein
MGGGSKSTEVKIPEWLEDAGKEALARSRDVSRIPYAAYYGPDVAAMTPMQVAAMRGTNQMAEAFGSPTADVTAGMPPAQDYGGMSAYSAGPMYDAALAELQRRQPGTYDAIMAQFGGTAGAGGGVGSSASATGYVPTMEPRMPMRDGRDAMPSQGGARSTTSMATVGAYLPGGIYTANPDSTLNRMAAAASPPQGAPTQANRPVARPADAGSAGMGGRK